MSPNSSSAVTVRPHRQNLRHRVCPLARGIVTLSHDSMMTHRDRTGAWGKCQETSHVWQQYLLKRVLYYTRRDPRDSRDVHRYTGSISSYIDHLNHLKQCPVSAGSNYSCNSGQLDMVWIPFFGPLVVQLSRESRHLPSGRMESFIITELKDDMMNFELWESKKEFGTTGQTDHVGRSDDAWHPTGTVETISNIYWPWKDNLKQEVCFSDEWNKKPYKVSQFV